MNQCVHPLGHDWSSEDPELTWSTQFGVERPQFPGSTFHGERSVMVVCMRTGCPEIGYRIVAQNLSQREAS